MCKKLVALMLVLVFVGVASAADILVGEWKFDNDLTTNTGAAAPLGDGTLSGAANVTGGVLYNPGAPGDLMTVGGGRDPVKEPPTWADLDVFRLEFDIDVTGNDSWVEPAEKQIPGSSSSADSDWLLEMNGPVNNKQLMFRPIYIGGGSTPEGYVDVTIDMSGGMHRVEIVRDVTHDGQDSVVGQIWVDGNLIGEAIGSAGTGSQEMYRGGTIQFAGGEKYPGDSGPCSMDNIELWEIPEPATIALLGLGGLALIRRKR